MNRRVDRMESSIAPLANKIDVVLNRMGVQDPTEKKLSKRDMENMFDQILQSEDGEPQINLVEILYAYLSQLNTHSYCSVY